jgi:ubiquinone/menaquinone biosynthesis C-methylase UbiE
MSAPLDATGIQSKDVYQLRFKNSMRFRNEMWKILCHDYFQKFIPDNSTVLEIAAGHCEFINNIRAAGKIAVDINESTETYASPDVKVLLAKSTDLNRVADASIDVVFVSNFFEHISKADITLTMKECLRVLKGNGKLLILQPNIRFVYKDYWMFYDHITPLDDRAMKECLEITGFTIHYLLPRFLPYTNDGRFPQSLFLVKLYLKIPLLYRIFGGQAFIIARKPV